ncbi:MAG: methyltransferase domain-containing protein [Oscillospiraceae bacterium]|nr:methyltransferase domain-containing protein [Oscillospiraceae bacterium]
MPNYEVISNFYDLLDTVYFKRKEHSPRTAMLNMIPDKPIRVLDICAGTCSNSVLIAQNKKQAKVTALDSSAKMLDTAKTKFSQHNISNIETIVADVRYSGFPPQSFDVIIVSLILHEVSESMRKVILSESKRLLNDNGNIIVIEWEQPVSLRQKFLFALIKLIEPRGFRDFLKLNLTAYFEQAGFKVIETRNCDYTKVYRLSK